MPKDMNSKCCEEHRIFCNLTSPTSSSKPRNVTTPVQSLEWRVSCADLDTTDILCVENRYCQFGSSPSSGTKIPFFSLVGNGVLIGTTLTISYSFIPHV